MSDTEKKQPMFVMVQPDTFQWPVKVRIPLRGQYGEAEFMATFPNLTEEELDKLLASKEKGGEGLETKEICRRVLLGFEPIPMPDGSTLPFNPQNFERLLSMPRVASAVVSTLIVVCRGVAAEKN